MGGQEGRRGSQVDWRSGGQRRLGSRGPWAASEHGPQFPACGLKDWLAFSGAVSSAPPDKVLPLTSLWLRVPGTSTTHAHTHLLRPLPHPGALCFIPTLSLANSYACRKTSMRCPLSQKALLWPPLGPAHWSSCHLPRTLDIWQGVQATPRGRHYVPTPSSALCYDLHGHRFDSFFREHWKNDAVSVLIASREETEARSQAKSLEQLRKQSRLTDLKIRSLKYCIILPRQIPTARTNERTNE